MPLLISQVETRLKSTKKEIVAVAIKKLGLLGIDVEVGEVYKTSLDARKQQDMKFVSSVYIALKDVSREAEICEKNSSATLVNREKLSPVFGCEKQDGRIVIAGFGPAGMFAALTLAEYGYRPIVLERGEDVDSRAKKVSSFWDGGALDVNSNVQFGEGGAGTFSDGKLTTRTKDPLCAHVLEKLVELGAPREILHEAKPHIGTDNLRTIVKSLRERVIELGGEVRFCAQITDVITDDGGLVAVYAGDEIPTKNLVLAIGHSARDTFEMLLEKGLTLEAKPFAVGARIEHTQESVNRSLYGKFYDNPLLPIGEYQLSNRYGARGVYTFCMCPGGSIIPASSEAGGIVTNGMSEFSRDGKFANSAVVVSVTPDDFGSKPLDGVAFAREIERKAFALGGNEYAAPATSVGAFLDGNSEAKILGDSSYALGLTAVDFSGLLPKFVTDLMRAGLRSFTKQLPCFGERDALLIAPETRTSSPVRITRGEDGQSVSTKGIYPCGEGAGYAGGIMSAAVDGVKVALKIMEKYAI